MEQNKVERILNDCIDSRIDLSSQIRPPLNDTAMTLLQANRRVGFHDGGGRGLVLHNVSCDIERHDFDGGVVILLAKHVEEDCEHWETN